MAWIVTRYEQGDEARFIKKVDVSRETWRLWKGKAKPSMDNLGVILEAYPLVNPEWLVTGRGPRERPADEAAGTVSGDIMRELGNLYERLAQRYGEPRAIPLFPQMEAEAATPPAEPIADQLITETGDAVVAANKARLNRRRSGSSGRGGRRP